MTRELFLIKYSSQVAHISERNKVDLGVAGDMFIADMKHISDMIAKAKNNWYAGVGAINIDQAMVDYAEYVAALPKAKGMFKK